MPETQGSKENLRLGCDQRDERGEVRADKDGQMQLPHPNDTTTRGWALALEAYASRCPRFLNTTRSYWWHGPADHGKLGSTRWNPEGEVESSVPPEIYGGPAPIHRASLE